MRKSVETKEYEERFETIAKLMEDAVRKCTELKEFCDASFMKNEANAIGSKASNVLRSALEIMITISKTWADTEADRNALEAKLSELLCHVTGGRFSKSTYSISDMKRFADDYQQEECEKCEELAQVKRERDAAVEQLRGKCFACAKAKRVEIGAGNMYTCEELKIGGYRSACPEWEWRGVQEGRK